MTYAESMRRFGVDKPDLRFGLEIVELSEVCKDSGFSVFDDAIAPTGAGTTGAVRGINVKGSAAALTRKEIDKLTELVRGVGAKGLAWVKLTNEGLSSSFGKFISPEKMDAIAAVLDMQEGDTAFIMADARSKNVYAYLGALRNELGRRLALYNKGEFKLVWITEFPFFEHNDETGGWDAMHHPFTSPLDECVQYLDSDPGAVRAKAYDLVANGIELSSGSIRITDPALQSRMFSALGMSEEEARTKFGFLLDAFSYGPPPHGGMAIGIDRLVMIMTGAATLREVVAFPKTQNASEPMTLCPSPGEPRALKELGLRME